MIGGLDLVVGGVVPRALITCWVGGIWFALDWFWGCWIWAGGFVVCGLDWAMPLACLIWFGGWGVFVGFCDSVDLGVCFGLVA